MLLLFRESEILHLRRAIDHNEKVIFQVYEQRQAAWEKSLVDAQKANGEKLEDQRKAALQQQQKLLMQVGLDLDNNDNNNIIWFMLQHK